MASYCSNACRQAAHRKRVDAAVIRADTEASPSPPRYRIAEWTAERVREAEARLREQNVVQRVVVAVSEATGEVAVLTQMDLYTAYPEWALQQDTAVIPAYRGWGLGRWVKAQMLRALLADRPSTEKIYTNVNADNEHMIRVNRQIGFTTSRSTVWGARTLQSPLSCGNRAPSP